MKTKLITALRACALALENGTFAYEWTRSNRCNCGVLASAITGLSVQGLATALPKGSGATWREMIGNHCPITGRPEHEVFAALYDAGLSAKDLVELEELSNPRVLKRVNAADSFEETKLVKPTFFRALIGEKTKQVKIPSPVVKTAKCCLISYMRHWAEILVEDGRMDSAPQKVQETAQAIS